MRNKSFTLIELLVVIVIIGILAGVIMISTSSSIDKANIAKLKVFEENMANNLAANMVSRWKLDGNTNDSWGSNNGTPTNVIYGLGYDGTNNGAAIFDGAGYIDCSNNNNLNPNFITNSVWIKTNNTIAGDYNFLSRNSAYLLRINVSDPGKARLILYINGGWRYSNLSNNRVDDNLWHNIVGTYDGNSIGLYIDGIKQGVNTIYAGTINVTANGTYIGARAAASERFIGLLDEARIYDAALSTSQIKQNYIAGLNSLLANGNISKKEYNERINSLSTIKY
ncbi:MAG TPA: prepilin-type N-terminal cleavage/methylation domain-containing protein [Candidatus Pacearchaeota archaeon]|mgnify:CR=1 FL=1|nr:prepilin-type N-terminal cleavage/methylation domain-containing protein [Candidatus Pacearchaeota archaeon]